MNNRKRVTVGTDPVLLSSSCSSAGGHSLSHSQRPTDLPLMQISTERAAAMTSSNSREKLLQAKRHTERFDFEFHTRNAYGDTELLFHDTFSTIIN